MTQKLPHYFLPVVSIVCQQCDVEKWMVVSRKHNDYLNKKDNNEIICIKCKFDDITKLMSK